MRKCTKRPPKGTLRPEVVARLKAEISAAGDDSDPDKLDVGLDRMIENLRQLEPLLRRERGECRGTSAEN